MQVLNKELWKGVICSLLGMNKKSHKINVCDPSSEVDKIYLKFCLCCYAC